MRRMLLVTVVAMMAASTVFAGPAFAKPTKEDPPNCVASSNASEASSFGNAEPGQVGSNNRDFAEAGGDRFGRGTSQDAQKDSRCEFVGEPGPPGAFQPDPGAPL